MISIAWNPDEKTREWAFAKEKLIQDGQLLPNGTKLRRKDYPNDLNHSFMVMDGRIFAMAGKGNYLAKSRDSHAKIAEDEAGHGYVLKIITKDHGGSNSLTESIVASDLGIAGNRVRRNNKAYIVYRYLGRELLDYLRENQSLSLDKRYELAIKVSLALHDIHSGNKAKSKKSYEHNDIHWGNITIDEQNQPHFIDFGKASRHNPKYPIQSDIERMLLLFYTPPKDRDDRHEDWIFGNWIAEYVFRCTRPEYDGVSNEYFLKDQIIYLHLNPEDKNENGAFSIIHYELLDLYGVRQQGALHLSDLGIDAIKPKKLYLFHFDIEQSKQELLHAKILEIIYAKGYAITQKNRNEVLYNLLKDPVAFYRKQTIPTALDIAETLTLCRFGLESDQELLKQLSDDVRLNVINEINSAPSKAPNLNEIIKIALQKNEERLQEKAREEKALEEKRQPQENRNDSSDNRPYNGNPATHPALRATDSSTPSSMVSEDGAKKAIDSRDATSNVDNYVCFFKITIKEDPIISTVEEKKMDVRPVVPNNGSDSSNAPPSPKRS